METGSARAPPSLETRKGPRAGEVEIINGCVAVLLLRRRSGARISDEGQLLRLARVGTLDGLGASWAHVPAAPAVRGSLIGH
jgi:hypothetical protein